MPELPVSPVSPGSEPARHYDTVVEAWGELLGEDLHYGYFESGEESLVAATDALTDQMLGLAALRPGMDVLDIGCGTGKAACRMAAEYAARVTGISPSTVCIQRAAALAGERGLAQLAGFCPGDGTALAFADGSFDRVWVMESSHLMQDKEALIAECARVLRPGGRVVLCDITVQRKLALEQVIEYRDEFLLLRDVFGRAMMEPLEFYRSQFETLGLTVVEQRDITTQTFATFRHWRTNAEQNRQAVSSMIGERAWQQFHLACDVLENFWRSDVLGYGIISAHSAG